MRITEIWRYPVKSMGGQRLTVAQVGPTGIEHDRGWGVIDDATGNVLTARREPALLMATATVTDGELTIRTTDGRDVPDSAALSTWLGRPVTLTVAGDEGGTYENPLDAEHDADWVSWKGPGGAWHDSTRARVSIVSAATLTEVVGSPDVRRFRINLVVDGAGDAEGEDDLVGRRIRIGSVEATVEKRIDRCVMVTRPQPGLDRDLDVLRHVNRQRGGLLGVGCLVDTPGEIHEGDVVEVLDPA